MKCQKCGADSRVLATRAFKTVMTKRSRECFNGHRFDSVEVPAGAVWPGRLARVENGTRIRARSSRVRNIVLAHPQMSAASLATKAGVGAAYVRKIRSAA